MMLAPLRAVRRAMTTHHRRAEPPVRDPYEAAQALARRHQEIRRQLARQRAEREASR